METLERKSFKLKIDAKSVTKSDDGTTAYFEGYASTFGNEDSYGDVVDPGAFTKTIQSHGDGNLLPMLWQHDTDEVIGVYPALAENETGLQVRGAISLETQRGREAYALLKMGAIKSMSIGFTTIKDVVDAGVRRLKELKLWEISLVTFPANELAAITAVKNADAAALMLAELRQEILALTERLAALEGEQKEEPEAEVESIEDPALAEARSLLAEMGRAAAGTRTGKGADQHDDGEPSTAHYLTLIREMRSNVSADLATR